MKHCIERKDRTAVALVILLSLIAPATSAQLEKGSTFRRTLTGIVVNAAGEPVPGVLYWVNNFHVGRGEVQYSGYITEEVTDETGRFRCQYGGRTRPEESVSVAFFHPKYAPTWIVRKSADDSPVTVQLDPGVELKGIAAVNGYRAGDSLYQWPLRLRLDCWNNNLGGYATRIKVKTDSEGRFAFRIPSDFTSCHYDLYFAGHKSDLKLQSGKPLPFIELRNTVEMDLKPVETEP